MADSAAAAVSLPARTKTDACAAICRSDNLLGIALFEHARHKVLAG
jgi:hypothetical protein